MNEDEKQTEVNEMSRLLIRLRPARAEIDSRVVFYEAGFSACQSQGASRGRLKYAPLIAAGVLAALITAPASFRIGQTAAIQTAPQNGAEVVVQNRRPDVAPAKERPQQHEAQPKIDTPKRWPKSELLARWIGPFAGIAESVELRREADTTLAVFHSSLVFSDGSRPDWINIPLSTTLARRRDWESGVPDNVRESTSPLAVSDLQQLAHSLETTR